jgi:exopolysaccharide biosynthesis protein
MAFHLTLPNLFRLAVIGSCLGLFGTNRYTAVAQTPSNSPVPLTPAFLAEGNQVLLNGRPQAMAWAQWQDPNGQPVLGVSDAGLINRLGLELSDSEDPKLQPVFWFSSQEIRLATRFHPSGEYRYLDIRDLSQQGKWQTQIQGNTLQINTEAAQIQELRLGKQAWGMRLVIDLSRPTPWFISRLTNSRNGVSPREFAITVDATVNPDAGRLTPPAGSAIQAVSVAPENGRTVIRATLAGSLRPQVTMLSNPSRLIVDLRPDAPVGRNIVWAPGLRWREQTLALGRRQFPVSWLEINPRHAGVRLQPIWGDGSTLTGIQPLPQIAQRWQAAAAINGGFFNRERQLPLGAIRRDGQWISGPILNRGVIAWNDQGGFRVGRLSLQHSVVAGGQRLPINDLDSGYMQAGIARYTRAWGSTYTPLSGNETVATITNNRVANIQTANGPVAIPNDGFLLVARKTSLTNLAEGASVQVQMQTNPAELESYPNILGAGPLLVSSGQIVLNAAAEQFGSGLDAQLAPRSAIGQTADGKVFLATTHNRVGGAGPSLPEWAQLMRNMGAVDALNLDGGSSSSLYLGGRLVDRHSVTTARVHNAIGVFIQPQAIQPQATKLQPLTPETVLPAAP